MGQIIGIFKICYFKARHKPVILINIAGAVKHCGARRCRELDSAILTENIVAILCHQIAVLRDGKTAVSCIFCRGLSRLVGKFYIEKSFAANRQIIRILCRPERPLRKICVRLSDFHAETHVPKLFRGVGRFSPVLDFHRHHICVCLTCRTFLLKSDGVDICQTV